MAILATTDADLAPIRPLVALLNPGVDLTRLGSWCILPICCGALAAQSKPRQIAVFEAIDPYDQTSRLIAGGLPPDLLAQMFAELLKEWAYDSTGDVLARRRLSDAYQRKGKTVADIPAYLITWTRLAILMNSFADLDTGQFMPIRAWADGDAERWLELSFASGLLLSLDEDFPYDQLAQGEVARQDEPQRTQVRDLLRAVADTARNEGR